MVQNKPEEFLYDLERIFHFSVKEARSMRRNFHDEMRLGLAGKPSSLKMLPAFVDRATGKERGRFIALDLGGTNFRVMSVCLEGKGRACVEKTGRFAIPKAATNGSGRVLFDFIAKSVRKFLGERGVSSGEERLMGFTFSFPVEQNGIANGTLVNWTKGFSASGVVGKDVVAMLSDAFERNGVIGVRIAALGNDTVGTLEAGSYVDRSCDMGVIFGTGTNGCYLEKAGRIRKLKVSRRIAAHMIVNIEWGNFDRLLFNEYDDALDSSTHNPGQQRMEKMISGMYLGEIAGLVIDDMVRRKLVFRGHRRRFSNGRLKTSSMSAAEADDTPSLSKTGAMLRKMGVQKSTLAERAAVKRVCEIVSRRAADISAAAISSVVTWMDPHLSRKHTVAVDGALFERHPGFHRRTLRALDDIHGSKARMIRLSNARDGSGIGVAVAAAVAASKD